MTFALCTDDNYAMPCLVCITSIFENHKSDSCTVYVLTSGLNEDSIRKFNALAAQYRQTVIVHTVDDTPFSSLKKRHRYGTSMYYRFLLPEIIKEQTCLYLDCDIIVRKNLASLFATPIADVACGVVEDQRSDEIELHNRIRVSTPYFNSGVLLMNLDYWRSHDVKSRLIKYINEYPERCHFPDQDALNAVLAEEVTFLSFTYNFQEQWYWQESERAISYTKWQDIEQYKDDPAIVHYTWNIKPWMQQCWHCHKDWFEHYARLHDFVDFKITPRYKPTLMARVYAFLLRKCLAGIRNADCNLKGKTTGDVLSTFSIK